jgi:hypothetical protein
MVEIEIATPQSHPYRPELSLLRVRLLALGYHQAATERIVAYAAREGTLEGAPGLEAENMEAAETVFVEGMEANVSTDHQWYEGRSCHQEAPVYLDVESLLLAGGLLIGSHRDPWGSESLFDGATGRLLTDLAGHIIELGQRLKEDDEDEVQWQEAELIGFAWDQLVAVLDTRDRTSFAGPGIPRRELVTHVDTAD